MVGVYSGRLASEICTMAVLSPSEGMAVRLLSQQGIVINNKALRRVVRDVGQIGLSHRGKISIDQTQVTPASTLVIGVDGGRIRERQVKKGKEEAVPEKAGIYYRLDRTGTADYVPY